MDQGRKKGPVRKVFRAVFMVMTLLCSPGLWGWTGAAGDWVDYGDTGITGEPCTGYAANTR